MRRPLIENWTSDPEAQALVDLVTTVPVPSSSSAVPCRRVLEVGSYRGFGAVLMAEAGAQVWALDWHRGDSDLGPKDTLCSWWRNVRLHHLEDSVIGLVGRSDLVLPGLRPGFFDLAFVDGYHAYDAVRRDLELCLPLVRPGGAIAFHDYNPRIWPGVVRAVNELSKRLRRSLQVTDSLAVMRLPAD